MRTLVTGGAGFIGSNLVHALVGGGHEVCVVDDLSTGSAGNLHPAAAFRRFDIRDDGCAQLIAEWAPEVVVHLAAQADVGASILDPATDWSVNVDGSRAVARAARDAGARLVLAASSAAVYGEPAELPLLETSDKRPANPYGRSKLAMEAALAEDLSDSSTDWAVLRFSNVYGPRQSWQGEGGVIAIFGRKMVAASAPVVYGDGTQTRDFIYVGDVVGAMLAAMESEGPLSAEGPDGSAYNISTGRQASVNELVGTMRALVPYFGPVISEPARAGDVHRSALSPAKALAAFDWSAGAELTAGLASTVRWLRAAAEQ